MPSPPSRKTPRVCTSVSLGYRVDSRVVGKAETVGLDVAGRNDSTSTVTAMQIKIKQLTSWSARGYKDRKKRTLASVVVEGSSLGALEAPAEMSTDRRQSLAAIADSAREDLQRQIAAGAGTRYELVVPEHALLTVKTDTVEVQHFLVVKLKITCACCLPDISTPLQVQKPPDFATVAYPGAGALPSALPDAAPLVEAVPIHSDTMIEVGGKGDDGPAPVS